MQVGDLTRLVLNLPQNDLAGLYSQYASLLSLIADVENRLRSLDDPNREQYLLCFEPIKRAFHSVSLQHGCEQITNAISTSDLALLNLASQRLDLVQREILLPPSEINALQSEVQTLFQQVSASDLAPELRIIILDLLEAIRRTLNEYQIRGAEGLKRVLAECFGRMSLDKEIVVQHNKRPELKSFLDLLSKLNGLFTAATNADKIGKFLGDSFSKLLQ